MTASKELAPRSVLECGRVTLERESGQGVLTFRSLLKSGRLDDACRSMVRRRRAKLPFRLPPWFRDWSLLPDTQSGSRSNDSGYHARIVPSQVVDGSGDVSYRLHMFELRQTPIFEKWFLGP